MAANGPCSLADTLPLEAIAGVGRQWPRSAFVCRLLPLTCLAPDIVEAILDGRQPKGLRLAKLLGDGPVAWEEQRENFGVAQRRRKM